MYKYKSIFVNGLQVLGDNCPYYANLYNFLLDSSNTNNDNNTNNSTSSNDESNIKDTNISTNEKTSNNNSFSFSLIFL